MADINNISQSTDCIGTQIILERQENLMTESDELKQCVREFFEQYLNRREESDSGTMFSPITISCQRAMMVRPLGALLERMRVLSGAEKVDHIGK